MGEGVGRRRTYFLQTPAILATFKYKPAHHISREELSCAKTVLALSRSLGRVSSRSCLWDCYWGLCNDPTSQCETRIATDLFLFLMWRRDGMYGSSVRFLTILV